MMEILQSKVVGITTVFVLLLGTLSLVSGFVFKTRTSQTDFESQMSQLIFWATVLVFFVGLLVISKFVAQKINKPNVKEVIKVIAAIVISVFCVGYYAINNNDFLFTLALAPMALGFIYALKTISLPQGAREVLITVITIALLAASSLSMFALLWALTFLE